MIMRVRPEMVGDDTSFDEFVEFLTHLKWMVIMNGFRIEITPPIDNLTPEIIWGDGVEIEVTSKDPTLRDVDIKSFLDQAWERVWDMMV